MKQKQCKWFYVCPIKFYWEEKKLDVKWIEEYCNGNWEKCVRYYKEENGIYHPNNMLPNGEIDESL